MLIYESDYLTSHKRGNVLIQEWKPKNLGVDTFQNEIQNFRSLYDKIACPSLIWLQENLSIDLSLDLQFWIEEKTIVPNVKAGLKNILFTIPKKLDVQIALLNSFNNVNSIIRPSYYTSLHEALIDHERYEEKVQNKINLEHSEETYIKSISKTNSSIELSVQKEDLDYTIKHLVKFKKVLEFKKANESNFASLTNRELEVFNLISKSLQSKEIASLMFISLETVNKHRKNIIRKLGISQSSDWWMYTNIFL